MVKHSRDVALIAGVVYFIQGAIGISGIALPLFLRNLKWSVAEITTISSIAGFPWVVKIFYGLLSDAYPFFGYRRKSYLILFSILSAAGWMSLVFLPTQHFWILCSMILTNIGFAATDVITDGLIVEHSNEFTSPIYQAIAWGSRSAGALITGFLGGWLASRWPPQNIFFVTMLLPLSIMFTALWIREKKRETAPFKSLVTPFRQSIRMIFSKNLRWFAAILIVAAISSSFGVPFFFFMKETLGFKETFLGGLSSLGWGGAMVGSFIYFRWLRQVSPKITLRCAIFFNSINIFTALMIKSEASALILVFVSGVMGCLVMLPVMSSAASLTHNTGVEGTLFAILMSVFNLGQIVFGFTGGRLYEHVGLYPMIAGTGIIALTGIFFVEKLEFAPGPHKTLL